jgi:hypothetical protein
VGNVTGIRERAQERFGLLRSKATDLTDFDRTSPDAVPGWCVSTIARIAINDAALVEPLLIGETPITHADAEPMHLNIARILDRPNVKEIERLLSDDGLAVGAPLEFAKIEVVVTDFVVTPETLSVVEVIDLTS